MLWFLNLVEHIKNRIPGFNKISRRTVLTGAILFLCAASLLPLLLAGFYNHMSGDDWYNAKFVHEQMISGHFSIIGLFRDIWGDLVDLYSRWSFTYTGYFLCYIMPMGFSENNGWMHTVLLLLCAVICMYAFFTKILGGEIGKPTGSLSTYLCNDTVHTFCFRCVLLVVGSH